MDSAPLLFGFSSSELDGRPSDLIGDQGIHPGPVVGKPGPMPNKRPRPRLTAPQVEVKRKKLATTQPAHQLPNVARATVRAIRSEQHAAKLIAKAGTHVLGAVPAVPVGKKLTAKQTAAIAKAKAAQQKADAAIKALAPLAAKAKTAAIAAKGMLVSLKKFKPLHTTGLHGDILGVDPDPNNPGYLTDGTRDPAYTDTGAGLPADTSVTPTDLVPPPVIQPPALSDVVNSIAQFPDGTIIKYDGSKGYPQLCLGSYSAFYGPGGIAVGGKQDNGQVGYFYGWKFANFPNNNMDPQWVFLGGSHTGGVAGNPAIWDRWDDAKHKDALQGLADVWQRSISGHGINDDDWTAQTPDYTLPGDTGINQSEKGQPAPKFGPIIGNPRMAFFKNMRYAPAEGVLFWFAEEAPDELTAPAKYAAAKAKQIADAADAAAAAADLKAQQVQAAQDAAAQATQDAANALAESAEASAANVAASQQTTLETTQAQQVQQQSIDIRRQQIEAVSTLPPEQRIVALQQIEAGQPVEFSDDDDGSGDDGSDDSDAGDENNEGTVTTDNE